MSDIRKKVILDGDTSGLVSSVGRAQGVLDQFGRTVQSTKLQTDENTGSTNRYKQAVDRLAMTVDKGYASQKRYHQATKTLDDALLQGAISQSRYNSLVKQAAVHYNVAEGAAEGMNRAMRASRFHTANLAAQFFDVSVMMSSGQNPLIMGMQQGSQFSQVLQVMGGTAKTQMKALGAAFMQLVNPISLVSIGLVAGAGYLFQYLTAAEKTEEGLSDLEEAMKSLKEQSEQLQLDTAALLGGFDNAEQAVIHFEIVKLRQEENKLAREIEQIEVKNVFRADQLRAQKQAQLVEIQAQKQELENILKLNEEERKKQKAIELSLQARKSLQENFIEKIKEGLAARREENRINEALIGQGRVQASISQEMRNQMDQYQTKMAETFKSAASLNSELGEGAATMLAMAGYDITGPIDEAAKSALKLARQLGISLGILNALRTAAIMGGQKQQSGPRRESGRTLPQVTANVPGSLGEIYQNSLPDNSVGGGGGGSAQEDPIVAELERLQSSLQTQTEMELANFEERQQILEEALEKKLLTQQEYNELMQRAQNEHAKNMVDLDQWQYMTGTQKAAAAMGLMADIFQSGNERMMQIAKVFSAGQALINAWEAYTDVLANQPGELFTKLAAGAAVLSAAMGAVSAIRGVGKGSGGTATAPSVSPGSINAGSISSQRSTPATSRSLTIIGDRFNREQAIAIAEFMNDGTDDGLVIRGRT